VSKTYRLDGYREKAKQSGKEPFVLEVGDDDNIVIARPTGRQMMELETATSSRQVMEVLCGAEVADRLIELVGNDDADVLASIGDDIRAHFGLGA